MKKVISLLLPENIGHHNRYMPRYHPRVEYELTPIGYELKAIINELEKWGKKHKAIKAR